MKNLLRRIGLVGALAGSLGISTQAANAQTCLIPHDTVLDLVLTMIDSVDRRKMITDADGKVYIKVEDDLDTINELIRNTDKYMVTPGQNNTDKNFVYETLERALGTLEPHDNYVIELNLKGDKVLRPGEVSNIYNRDGRQLRASVMYPNCQNSFLKFEE